MDGNAKLTKITLAKSLNAACATLANYIEAETGEITAKQIAVLPDAVFNMAVDAGWLSEPENQGDYPEELDADHVYLGHYVVGREFRETFVALIQQTLNEIEPYSEEIVRRRWHEEAQEEMRFDELLKAKQEFERLYSSDFGRDEPAVKPRPGAKDIFRRWQEDTGKSLDELAEKAGWDVQTARRIRDGKFGYTRSRQSLHDFANVLKCDWQDLLPHK